VKQAITEMYMQGVSTCKVAAITEQPCSFKLPVASPHEPQLRLMKSLRSGVPRLDRCLSTLSEGATRRRGHTNQTTLTVIDIALERSLNLLSLPWKICFHLSRAV